jgi:hypothetical protein
MGTMLTVLKSNRAVPPCTPSPSASRKDPDRRRMVSPTKITCTCEAFGMGSAKKSQAKEPSLAATIVAGSSLPEKTA